MIISFVISLSLLLLSGYSNPITNEVKINNVIVTKEYSLLKKSKMKLKNPDLKIKLSKDLKEISGLTALPKNQLAAIQDEKGTLFIIDIPSGEISNEIKFNKKGDYEGLCSIDGIIYIIDSAGDITQVNLESEESTTFSTKLNHKNNVEGLCVHPNGKELLFALKGNSELNDNSKKFSSIFSYNLNTNSINPEPFIKIYSNDIEDEFDVKIKQEFSPSGICYWKSKYYILSHQSCALVVYSEEKELIDYIELDRKLFPQPEGICVANDMLYICNEGRKKSATILGFKIE